MKPTRQQIWFHRISLAQNLCLVIVVIVSLCLSPAKPVFAQEINPSPPTEPVKLIFIHHSTGENWLTDGNGNLGVTLGQNNYFVSDTNYGWGPDGIGDRTDIVNWTEWFRGPNSEHYLDALFAESGRNSSYARTLPDPGGENQIVMFKSCFPNSNLEGNPDDAPLQQDWALTVSNAKYIYNDLLNYSITRPDKLFIVITAPPLLDPTYSANARSFNTWLVNDWLVENNYPLNNVAVWDYYNILTDPDNHHYYNNGTIEYSTGQGGDILYYPTDGGDEHPSPQGNQKATSEFVPMLNTFYQRWMASAPAAPPPQPEPAPISAPEEDTPPEPAEEPAPVTKPGSTFAGGIIDDFESGPPVGTDGWQAYWDHEANTVITCAPSTSMANSGTSSLQIDFDVVPESWATCALIYGEQQNWNSAEGIAFDLHASQAALVFDINAHEGTPDSQATYSFAQETMPESVDSWVHIELPWGYFNRVDWEPDDGTPLDPAQIMGLTFGFPTYTDTPNTGTIWIDNLQLLGAADEAPAAPAEETAKDTQPQPETETQLENGAQTEDEPQPGTGEEDERGGGLCPGSSSIVLLAALTGIFLKRKRGL